MLIKKSKLIVILLVISMLNYNMLSGNWLTPLKAIKTTVTSHPILTSLAVGTLVTSSMIGKFTRPAFLPSPMFGLFKSAQKQQVSNQIKSSKENNAKEKAKSQQQKTPDSALLARLYYNTMSFGDTLITSVASTALLGISLASFVKLGFHFKRELLNPYSSQIAALKLK